MTYRKIPFCLWLIDVGLHTFIFLFMTYKGTTLLRPLSRLKSEFRYYVLPPLGTDYFIAPLLHSQPQIKYFYREYREPLTAISAEIIEVSYA